MDEQADNQSLSCVDELGHYPQAPDAVVNEITEDECANIKANTGLAGNEKDNCPDLETMVCAIKQEVDAIANGAITISTNNESKCRDDGLPTLASMWSRILRWSQAVTCVLCAYDPYVATILKTGKYPQILMGAVQEGGYPQWVNPDELPTSGSKAPVTSGGVAKAIEDALLGVWHPWEEYPIFSYFAETLNSSDGVQNLTIQTTNTPPTSGDTALVASDGTHSNALYTYNGTDWVFTKELGASDGLTNFAVTNITKGYYATRDIYYFVDGSDHTWNVMDADLTTLEKQVSDLQKLLEKAIISKNSDTGYILTTAPTLITAEAVACDPDKPTIILITGE